ncbi:MAG: transporter substrate-binding domain-containing protein [Gammaproteobacteria bacterium]|nr:transporter substrate-binding domain-containing protein [Gammaproteobacteria bacterium]MBU2222617.1 transporter substrate-binding domain-containing protein [Gammaproteobacteria bacterium]
MTGSIGWKLALCILAFPTFAAKKLKFVLYYPQIPPYMYQDAHTQKVVGVIPDLIEDFFKQQQVSVEFILDNRRGAELRLYSGDVDAMLIAREWAVNPAQLIFSEPVLAHRDFLFSLQPFAASDTPAKWLADKKVCTRQYYVYDALEPFFIKNGTQRIDASSELAQLRMLQNGRCDYAYLNEHVAKWIALHQLSDAPLYQSPLEFGMVGLTIALHPQWQAYLPGLNQYLQKAREQGLIDEKLDWYIKKPD